MKTESITWSIADSHILMLDYEIWNLTYKLDKIEILSLELDYQVMDGTSQIFVNSS